jgi:hypothetical protein
MTQLCTFCHCKGPFIQVIFPANIINEIRNQRSTAVSHSRFTVDIPQFRMYIRYAAAEAATLVARARTHRQPAVHTRVPLS